MRQFWCFHTQKPRDFNKIWSCGFTKHAVSDWCQKVSAAKHEGITFWRLLPINKQHRTIFPQLCVEAQHLWVALFCGSCLMELPCQDRFALFSEHTPLVKIFSFHFWEQKYICKFLQDIFGFFYRPHQSSRCLTWQICCFKSCKGLQVH